MPNTKHAPRYARTHSLATPPRSTMASAGSVVTLDATTMPAVHTPDEGDIYKVVTELDKKLQHLSRNQKVLETKLDRIAARLDAVDANLITGVQFLSRVMNSIGWWATGDTDMAESTYPPNPHWQ